LQTGLVELGDPAFLDLVDRGRIEVVKPFASAPDDGHEAGPLQDVEMLGGRLARHVQAVAQLAQRLAVVLAQTVEQPPPGGIGQRFEDLVHRCRFVAHTPIMQVFTCIMPAVVRSGFMYARCVLVVSRVRGRRGTVLPRVWRWARG
jgi:hypothetical protein